uniref:Uncharacterized protein n=1 Tax=Nelumbo nucifera TaxID=4432 RepID=A0A822XTC3_NELNU|nr:TPA_asm: hypothetical protein HUJ06_026328 [Nelumbo nucifera]
MGKEMKKKEESLILINPVFELQQKLFIIFLCNSQQPL